MMIPSRARQVVAGLTALALAACGVTRPSVTLMSIGVVHVPAAMLPADAQSSSAGDALRIDFYSNPELLTEEGYVLDDARFCNEEETLQIRNQTIGPFLGDASIRHPFARRKLAVERASGPSASARPVYSTYVFVAQPTFPTRDQLPARAAYDLAREPRPLCLSLSLREGYELARTTNTLTFSAEQIAASLRASR